MGLTIYYKGVFSRDNSINEMINEVEDIAKIHNWKYTIFEREFEHEYRHNVSQSDRIYGISFSPPNCEPVCITFLADGCMCSPWTLELSKKYKVLNSKYPSIFTKTQYAGPEVHKIVIDLFKYLSKKYFQSFELTDESYYWETGNEDVLKANFKKYNDMMDDFAASLENTPIEENETAESFVVRVAKMMNLKRKT